MQDEQVFKARKTLYEMLSDRGYKNLNNILVDYETFLKIPENEKYTITGSIDNNGLPVVIHFYKDEIKTDDINETGTKAAYRDFYNKFFEKIPDEYKEKLGEIGLKKIEAGEDIDRLVKMVHFIAVYNVTKAEGKLYSFVEADNPKLVRRDNFEFFGLPKLQFNVTKHELQPKFRLLNEEEKKQVFDKFNATSITIKKMCLNDVIVGYYNARVGDMFEITGNGYPPSYRIVSARLISKRTPKKKEQK